MYDEAAAVSAATTSWSAGSGPTPEDELEAVAEMTAAINDARPTTSTSRTRSSRPSGSGPTRRRRRPVGDRLYRVLARHRETGELAGTPSSWWTAERPSRPSSTTPRWSARHRGHRLGLLLKAEMNLWLREAEPQLETIDTWNAESNDHMIGVNELLGYRVLGASSSTSDRSADPTPCGQTTYDERAPQLVGGRGARSGRSAPRRSAGRR